MNLANAVSKRTKELLLKNKITQYRLTKTTCLNEKTIRDLLNNRTSDIKLSTIFLIAQTFNMTLEEFFNSDIFANENIEL